MKAVNLVIFSLGLVAIGGGVGSAVNTEDAEVKQLKSLIFDRKGTPLGNDETFELLQKLLKHYDGREGDHESNRIRYQIRDLVMLRTMWRSKCNLESFNEIKSMIYLNSDYRANLVPYLKDCLVKRFDFCRSIIGSEIEKAIEELSETDKRDIDLLMDEVNRAKKAQLEAEEPSKITRSPIVDGIVNFMRIQLNQSNDPKIKFNKKLVASVPELCHRVFSQLKSPMEIFVAVQNEKSFIDRLDNQTTAWLEKQNLCRDILLSKDTVTDEVLDILVAHNGNGRFCGLFACFGRKQKKAADQ